MRRDSFEENQVEARVMASADVDERAALGAGTTVWHLAQIREGATLGTNCIIGRGAYVGTDVRIGNNVKLQNHALVYEPARLEDGVFIGPAAVLTNDMYPRSVDPDGKLKRGDDWEAAGVTVREGAAVGARAVVVAGCTVGRWALVAAGAVVTRDVPDFALVVGVPARRIKWVGRAGVPLEEEKPDATTGGTTTGGTTTGSTTTGSTTTSGAGSGDHTVWVCPRTGDRYVEADGRLTELASASRTEENR